MSIDTSREAFQRRLLTGMQAAGLDQSALATELATSQSTVSEWCSGKRVPAGELMMRLPLALGVDGHWLLTGQGQPSDRPEELGPAEDRIRRLTASAMAIAVREAVLKALANFLAMNPEEAGRLLAAAERGLTSAGADAAGAAPQLPPTVMEDAAEILLRPSPLTPAAPTQKEQGEPPKRDRRAGGT